MSNKIKTIKVQVKPAIVKAGGGFHDFSSGADLYPKKPGQVFEVELTPFIARKLDTGELIKVGDKSAKPADKKGAVDPAKDADNPPKAEEKSK